MSEPVIQLAIEDIADRHVGASLFGLEDRDALEISVMDVVIAVIVRP